MNWRAQAAPVIAKALAAARAADEKETKRMLHEAYPFGPRQYHPYKIWLDEVKVQTGKKPVKERNVLKPEPVDPNQGVMF